MRRPNTRRGGRDNLKAKNITTVQMGGCLDSTLDLLRDYKKRALESRRIPISYLVWPLCDERPSSALHCHKTYEKQKREATGGELSMDTNTCYEPTRKS